MQAKIARKARTIKPVHIIEGGYCYACEGECKYIDNEKLQIEDNVVIILGDLPEDGEYDFSSAPTATLEKLANMKEGEADGAEEENQTQTG